MEKAASPTQRTVLIRCLGRTGGVALDERFERLLAQPEETVAVTAVEALADSRGPAVADRLWRIAETDDRPSVKVAAYESLATTGSELALPYLQEKLKDPAHHAEACFQLARLRHPEAEQVLAETAQTATRSIFPH